MCFMIKFLRQNIEWYPFKMSFHIQMSVLNFLITKKTQTFVINERD